MLSGTNPCVLVYDVGGSHISAAVCHAGDYRLGPIVKASHSERQTSEAFVDVLVSLAEQASTGADGVQGASVAMPGPFDYAAGVSWMKHKLPYLYGVDLRQSLAARFGWQPGQVRFLNDAAAYLLGEVGAGAGRGATRAVGITLGTGIGSAFAVNGRVVSEGAGVPPGGEIWNLPYEGGIVEDLLSSKAIRQSYEQRTGRQREVAAIASAAATDAVASEVFAEFGRRLGRVLKSLLAAFTPNVVVLGGGIARSAPLFLPFAEKQLEGLNLSLRVSALGDRAPLVGAGVAWFADSVAATQAPAAEAS
jgi:glucokinase